jgi:hypothetical protein
VATDNADEHGWARARIPFCEVAVAGLDGRPQEGFRLPPREARRRDRTHRVLARATFAAPYGVGLLKTKCVFVRAVLVVRGQTFSVLSVA